MARTPLKPFEELRARQQTARIKANGKRAADNARWESVWQRLADPEYYSRPEPRHHQSSFVAFAEGMAVMCSGAALPRRML